MAVVAVAGEREKGGDVDDLSEIWVMLMISIAFDLSVVVRYLFSPSLW